MDATLSIDTFPSPPRAGHARTLVVKLELTDGIRTWATAMALQAAAGAPAGTEFGWIGGQLVLSEWSSEMAQAALDALLAAAPTDSWSALTSYLAPYLQAQLSPEP